MVGGVTARYRPAAHTVRLLNLLSEGVGELGISLAATDRPCEVVAGEVQRLDVVQIAELRWDRTGQFVSLGDPGCRGLAAVTSIILFEGLGYPPIPNERIRK